MNIHAFFDDASRVMSVLSFATFIGILAWAFLFRTEQDFEASAALPFADEPPGDDHV